MPILQTAQDRVAITQGGENLRVFRNTPRGPLRWYASCCGTPLFYTPPKARLVHAGLNVDTLDDPDTIGPVVARGFVPDGKGGTRHEGALRMVGRMIPRMLSRNLNGSWRDSPFFAKDGAPVAPPHLLTREERAAALMAVKG